MAGLTAFGIEIRKLRLDKRMRLLDLADKLGKSPAFVSAIETGRKPIPDNFVREVAAVMNLSTEELSKLRKAADRTRKYVTIERLPENKREIVAAFARTVDGMTADQLADLQTKIVLESLAGEQPFHRKRRGIVVPPLSTKAIMMHDDRQSAPAPRSRGRARAGIHRTISGKARPAHRARPGPGDKPCTPD